eukprot:scaffold7381_cov310-Pinguiococcus_pyrenoidosus.AAC.70
MTIRLRGEKHARKEDSTYRLVKGCLAGAPHKSRTLAGAIGAPAVSNPCPRSEPLQALGLGMIQHSTAYLPAADLSPPRKLAAFQPPAAATRKGRGEPVSRGKQEREDGRPSSEGSAKYDAHLGPSLLAWSWRRYGLAFLRPHGDARAVRQLHIAKGLPRRLCVSSSGFTGFALRPLGDAGPHGSRRRRRNSRCVLPTPRS